MKELVELNRKRALIGAWKDRSAEGHNYRKGKKYHDIINIGTKIHITLLREYKSVRSFGQRI
jgi:hypothetical protein